MSVYTSHPNNGLTEQPIRRTFHKFHKPIVFVLIFIPKHLTTKIIHHQMFQTPSNLHREQENTVLSTSATETKAN